MVFSKKLIAGSLMVFSMALTGCLTDDTTETNPGTALTTTGTNDTVWNIMGLRNGSFNLGIGATEGQAGTNGDLVDMSTGGAGGVTFPKTWTSETGTMFVMAPAGFNYTGATDSSVIKAYTGAAATTGVLAVGSKVIVRYRGGSRYGVINVTAVVETAADNLDYILFDYKLMP